MTMYWTPCLLRIERILVALSWGSGTTLAIAMQEGESPAARLRSAGRVASARQASCGTQGLQEPRHEGRAARGGSAVRGRQLQEGARGSEWSADEGRVRTPRSWSPRRRPSALAVAD